MKRLMKMAAFIAAKWVVFLTGLLIVVYLISVFILGLKWVAAIALISIVVINVLDIISWTKVAEFLKRKREKLATAGLAYSVDAVVNWLFNYPLYIWVMNEFGLEKGFAVMSCLSFLLCYVYIKIYDVIKKDLFLLEDVRDFMDDMANYSGKSKIKLFRAMMIKKGGLFTAFLALSIFKDPFYTLAFCRQERYNGFSLKDWGIFLGSVAVGNFIWALSVFGGIELFKYIIK